MPPIAGLALGAGSSILGGIMGGNASKKAARAQAEAAQRAANMATQSRDWAKAEMSNKFDMAKYTLGQARSNVGDLFGKARGAWDPYRQGGEQAFMNLGELMKPGGLLAQTWDKKFEAPDNITEQNDPGFQARLKFGQQMMERSAAAKGGLLTGGTAQAENQAAQDYASNEYGNVYNRSLGQYMDAYSIFRNNQNDQFSRLMGMTGVGQNAASATSGLYGQQAGMETGLSSEEANMDTQYGRDVSNLIMGTANTVGNDYMGIGNAKASGIMGANNAWQGALNGVNGAFDMYSLMKGSPSFMNNSGTAGWTVPSSGMQAPNFDLSGYQGTPGGAFDFRSLGMMGIPGGQPAPANFNSSMYARP